MEKREEFTALPRLERSDMQLPPPSPPALASSYSSSSDVGDVRPSEDGDYRRLIGDPVDVKHSLH